MALLTREQLENRLVALHRASLELVRDLSLETVLERIVHMAREQADASYAALGVVDEQGKLVKFIPVGMTPEEIERTGKPPVGKGIIGILNEARRPIRIANMENHPRSVGFPPGHPPMDSFLGVPILLGEKLLGQIYLTNKEGYPEFTETDERVIETLAAYAAVAINNARLYEGLLARDKALQQRNQDQALLNDIAASLATTLDVDEILDQTLRRVIAYLGVEAGEIFLRQDGSKNLRLALHRGTFESPFLKDECFQIGEGAIGKVAQSGQLLVSTNITHDIPNISPEMASAGFRNIACIPLSARGSVVGVMAVASKKHRQFEERELKLLASIGTWAGITIENAQLHRQTKRVAVLEERERIAMDLHDGIIQSIYGVGLALDFVRLSMDEHPAEARQRIEQAMEGLNKTIRDLRAYILDLRPRQMVGQNLREGLARLVEEYRANTLAEANLVAPQDGLINLPLSHATALFHICQEALANAAKHSHARRTDIQLWATPERVLLEIADNGRGFDLRKMSITLGHGLSNMHIRARKVGGDVEITSAPGEGTTVLAWVPRRAQ